MADNKTHSWSRTITGNTGRHDQEVHLYSINEINTSATSKIPPYSQINSITFAVAASKNPTGTTSIGQIKIATYDANNKELTSLASKGSLNFKGTENLSASISSYVSKQSNSGSINYSGASYIGVQLSFVVLYKHTFTSTGTVTWNYNEPRAIVSVSKSGEGTVTGAGTYHYGNSYTIKATPATGWKFVKWSDGNTSASRTFTVNSSLITAYETSKSYQAIFEKEKINKIYFGTTQPSKIYFGTREVKEVYYGTTKVYG